MVVRAAGVGVAPDCRGGPRPSMATRASSPTSWGHHDQLVQVLPIPIPMYRPRLKALGALYRCLT
eukprot:4526863-Prymnesium_polylepis.1